MSSARRSYTLPQVTEHFKETKPCKWLPVQGEVWHLCSLLVYFSMSLLGNSLCDKKKMSTLFTNIDTVPPLTPSACLEHRLCSISINE